MEKDLMPMPDDKWEKFGIQQPIGISNKAGWALVWSAFKAALCGKELLVTDRPVKISFWAKAKGEVFIANVQAEWKDQKGMIYEK